MCFLSQVRLSIYLSLVFVKPDLLHSFTHLLLPHLCRLKMSSLRSRHILIKLKLLEMGDLPSATRLDDLLLPTQVFAEEGVTGPADKTSLELEKQYRMYEERYQAFAKTRATSGDARHKANGNIKSLQRTVVESFQRNVASISKCENCQAAAVSFRKDGYSKIFQRPLSRRARFATTSNGKTLKVNKISPFFFLKRDSL